MTVLSNPIAYYGDRFCRQCGKVHDAYWIDPAKPWEGYSWASREDGHPYHPVSWERVARRYGFVSDREPARP